LAETYSLAITGVPADQTLGVKPHLTLPDSACVRGGAEQNRMSHGTQILCQNPDGSQSWYTIDAERWTRANPVLRRV
jgi:hypothetical protein